MLDPRVRELETLPWIKHFKEGPDDEEMLVKFVIFKRGVHSNISMLHFSSRDYAAPDLWVARQAKDQIERIVMIKQNLEENKNGNG